MINYGVRGFMDVAWTIMKNNWTRVFKACALAALIASAMAFSAFLTGCSNSESRKLAALKQNLHQQQDSIVRAGGDWNKLSPADQQAFIKGVGYGNEEAAKAYVAATYARDTAKMSVGPPAAPPRPPGPPGT